MTAMDELRAMLSERGTEYDETFEDGADYIWWSDGERDLFARLHHGALAVYGLSAQQAIVATLGGEDTYTREDVEGAFVSGYSLGLDMFDSSKPEKGWNQNEHNMDEEMEDLGWVRKDAATLGAGTCKNVHEPPKDTTFWPSPHFKCSECGATHVSMEYVFYCPNCGRKVVDA